MSRLLSSETALWLLVPIAFGLILSTYEDILESVKDAIVLPALPSSSSAKKVDDGAEDHVPVSALRDLAQGSSFELRKAASKIVAHQVLKAGPKAELLRDLESKDAEQRGKAIYALGYLIYGPDRDDMDFHTTRRSQQLHFQTSSAYRAIVTALENMLPMHSRTATDMSFTTRGHPPSPVRPFSRPTQEGYLLSIVLDLIRSSKASTLSADGGVALFLKAGLVTRWLARYPFPCTLPQYSKLNFKRSDVTDIFVQKAYARDDPPMAELFRELNSSPTACKELRAAGLSTKSSRLIENFPESSGWGEWDPESRSGWEEQELETAQEERTGMDLPRPRSADRSAAEDRLRRRHREAIVVADRGAPITNQNILQRTNSDGAASTLRIPESRSRRNTRTSPLPEPSMSSSIPSLSSLDALAPYIDPDTRQRVPPAVPVTENPGVLQDREDMASHLSFSEVESNATYDSMPSLLSYDGLRVAELESETQNLMADRLGARWAAMSESRPEQERDRAPQTDVPRTTEELVQMAVRRRELSRADGHAPGV
jgi:hypothetical protein